MAAGLFGLGAVVGLAVASPRSAGLGAAAPLSARRLIGGYAGDVLGAAVCV
jgi:hypothetical protein